MSAEKTTLEERRKNRRNRRKQVEEVNDDEQALEEELDDRGLTERKGRATPGRRMGKESSITEAATGNIVVRGARGIVEYLSGVRSEIEKVTWPTRPETRRLTLIVIASTVASAIILGIISLAFGELFRIGLRQPAILLGVILFAVVVAVFFFRRGGGGSAY